MKRPSARELAAWYDRLRAEGFDDVEMRRAPDGTWYEGPSTYAHQEVSLDADVGPGEWEGATPLHETPVALHFRALVAYASDLPRAYRGRALLVLYADTGDLLNSARRTGWSHRQARTILAGFLSHVEARKRGWAALLTLQVAVAELDGAMVAA